MSKKGGAGRKSRQKAVRHLRDLVAIHRRKLVDHPDAPEAVHWMTEIAAFEQQIYRHERGLGRDRG
jgi:hypothetical protein